MLSVHQLPVLTDNYIHLIHDSASQQTVAVDPAVAGPVLTFLQQQNWRLSYIFNTHHHSDHVGANLALKMATGCQIVGAAKDKNRIPGLDIGLVNDDIFQLGQHSIKILETPGHTIGHIVFYFQAQKLLFCGDTLFSMGCGRLFEGTAEQMWQSLQKIKNLSTETQIYCAHEYSLNNTRFALTVEPDNAALLQRMQQVQQLRATNQSTLPTTLALELATNPFLRADNTNIQAYLQVSNNALAAFTKLRQLKDVF